MREKKKWPRNRGGGFKKEGVSGNWEKPPGARPCNTFTWTSPWEGLGKKKKGGGSKRGKNGYRNERASVSIKLIPGRRDRLERTEERNLERGGEEKSNGQIAVGNFCRSIKPSRLVRQLRETQTAEE